MHGNPTWSFYYRDLIRDLAPDIAVFDESFVNHEVPFAAFTARKRYFDHWNRPGKSTFHSTTFQPNTIASLHFMRCLAVEDALGIPVPAAARSTVPSPGDRSG